MIVSRLALRNWRNFRCVEVRMGERVFLIGPNASGKSNLQDAFRFLRDLAKPGGGLQAALAGRQGLSTVRCLSAGKDPDVEIDVDLSGDLSGPRWRYAVGITQQVRGHRKPVLRYERVWREETLILDRPEKLDLADSDRLAHTHLEQGCANSDVQEVARFFASITEDLRGCNLLEMIAAAPERTRRARLRRIEAALRVAIPQWKSLTDVIDEARAPHLEAAFEHWRPSAARRREDQFSDGTLRLIAIFWSLLEGDAPLLLKNPEHSLHSEIVRRLPSIFSRLQRQNRRQIVVSTHSWDLLSERGIGAEEVLMLKPGHEGTAVQSVAEDLEIRAMLESGLSVAEAALPRTAPPEIERLDLESP